MYNFFFLECEKARDRNLNVTQMREINEARGPYLEKKKKKRVPSCILFKGTFENFHECPHFSFIKEFSHSMGG